MGLWMSTDLFPVAATYAKGSLWSQYHIAKGKDDSPFTSQPLAPFCGCLVRQDPLYKLNHLIPVFHPLRIGRKPLIL
jgi:hypothetical protein